MKRSICLICKSIAGDLLFCLSFIILLISLPAFGQKASINLKATSPQGENIIISMLNSDYTDKDSYIQIYNADVVVIDMSDWSLIGIEDGIEICTWTLSGTLKPGEAKIAGGDNSRTVSPDYISVDWNPGNNKWDGDDDGAKLYHSGSLIDNAYGSIDWTDGILHRNEDAGNASTSFIDSEWTAYSVSFDENYHNCKLPIIDIGPGLWSELTADFTKGASYTIIGDVEVDIDTPAECYSIYIQNGNTLSIQATAALTIYKNLNNYSSNAAFEIKANSSGSGSVIIHGISDNGTIEQYFEDTSLQNWKFISPPVKSAKSAIYENDYLMYYYEPQMRYVDITPTSTTLKIGKGYTVLKSQDSIEKYEGIFNNGDIQIPTLTNTLGIPFSTDENSGWNLIGNPYTSSIDWDLVTIPVDMYGQVSVWVLSLVNGEYVSDWKVWVNGVGDEEAHYIDPGEGFFVFAGATENLDLGTASQVHHFAASGKKNLPDGVVNETMEIKASGNNYSSTFYLRFLDEASHGFDSRFDAFKRLSDSKKIPQIYNQLEETILAANSIPPPAEDDILHLAFTSGTEGSYKLNFSGIDNFDYEQEFYLKDKVSGEITNLRLEPSIEFNYKTSDPENRFDILFGLINGTNDLEENEFDTNIYQSAGNIYIKTNYPQSQNLKVEIHNLLGQTVYTSSSISDFTNGKNLNLPNATYLVSISDKVYLFTEKVTVYN